MSLLPVYNFMTADQKTQPETLIWLDGVSVQYRVPTERFNTLKEHLIRTLQRRVSHVTFWALKDVSFTVDKGDIFGLIGNNGAGKSTLLKLIARVLRPTEGRVRVKGRVAPLLELGAGFHPELTGRENVYLNGAMLGYSHKEMEEKFHDIVDFAELGNFIDAPMRTYSSGMLARLGFAVATDEKPEVLILDEILSVGDEAFQRKCIQRIENFCANGTSILIVSHTMEQITDMCQRAAWLDHGRLSACGNAVDVVHAYREHQ